MRRAAGRGWDAGATQETIKGRKGRREREMEREREREIEK